MSNTAVTCKNCNNDQEIRVPGGAAGKILWECSHCGGRSLYDTGVADPDQIIPPTEPSSVVTTTSTVDDHHHHPESVEPPEREIHVSDAASAQAGIAPAGTVVDGESAE